MLRTSVVPVLVLVCVILLPRFAHAQSSLVTVEGGRNDVCETTNLPMGIWSLVAYDNAGQPCVTKAAQVTDPTNQPACDPNANWDWQVQGHLVLTNAPGYTRTVVEVQLWAGNGGGSCYGGTSDPIICDNPATHYLQEQATYELDQPAAFSSVLKSFSGPQTPTDMSVPFEFLFYLLPPYFSTPGDANYSGFWVFVKPIGRPAVCVSQNYWDLVHD
jgi:hypothetical protein